MEHVTNPINTATDKQQPLIMQDATRAEVTFPHVSLRSDSPPLRIGLTLKKQITSVPEIELAPDELPGLVQLVSEARAIREFPERERPRRLMELLRSKVTYSYATTLAELAETQPELVNRVQANNRSIPAINIGLLREAVRLGYANCSPLTIGLLILGKEAGLEGAFLGNAPGAGKRKAGMAEDPNPIVNIIRPDTHEGLFKSDSNYGVSIPAAHAWAEFRMSDGKWIPVDPSTQLVGDTPEGLQILRDAHYQAAVGDLLRISQLPLGVRHFGTRYLEFLPGEPDHTGVLEINAFSQEGQQHATYDGLLNMTFSLFQPPMILLGVPFTISRVEVSSQRKPRAK